MSKLRPGQHADDRQPNGLLCWCGTPLVGRQQVACSDKHRDSARSKGTTALALPSPQTATLPVLVSRCRAIYDRRDEIIGAFSLDASEEGRRRVKAIRDYLRGRAGEDEADRAARILEAAVGAALGPAEETQAGPGRGKPSLAGECFTAIPKDARYKFRRMYEHREVWEPLLKERPLSQSEVLRRIDEAQNRDAPAETAVAENLSLLVESGRKFKTIYADPPWLYSNQGTRAATSNHYGGMTVDELCALPVGELTDDNAHLHLWTTNAFLFEAPKIFEAWGFEFRSSFVWCKEKMGIGNYWRCSHEFLLTAIRGNSRKFADRSLMSWDVLERGRHSEKPERVRRFIERASSPPRLELFGRKEVEGWVVWGNEVSSSLLVQAERVA